MEPSRLSDISTLKKLVSWPEEDIPVVLKIEMHFLPRCPFLLKWLITDKHDQFPIFNFFESFCFNKC